MTNTPPQTLAVAARNEKKKLILMLSQLFPVSPGCFSLPPRASTCRFFRSRSAHHVQVHDDAPIPPQSITLKKMQNSLSPKRVHQWRSVLKWG